MIIKKNTNKQIITLLLVLLSSISVFAQKTDTAIFNGATKIIIKNSLTAAENYKACGNTMLALDYSIGGKDTEFFQLSSEPFKVAAQGASQVLAIYTVSKDNEITIIGRSKNLTTTRMVGFQDTENAYEVIPYKKIRPIAKLIYYKLDEFAKKLNGSITYSE